VLDGRVFAYYPQLSEAEIKRLVVADKWQAALQGAIAAEIERVTQQLANRVQMLEERYAEPLPQIVDEVAELSGKVDGHLQRMGLLW
jgi:type I restriction enzyme M protein